MTTRRSYAGGAAVATITADLSPVALAVPISTTTGWPTGSIGPFYVVINQGFSDEEKVLCTSLSGSTLTLQARGADGTSAQQHFNGATISPCITSADVDEANFHTSSNAGVHGVTGGVVGTTDSQVLSGKSFSDSPAWTDHSNCQHDHSSAVQGGSVWGTLTALTFTSPWANSAGGNAAGGSRGHAGGWVTVQGVVFSTSSAPVGNVIATGLPVPADAAAHSFTVADVTGAIHWVSVTATGALQVAAVTVGANNALTLDGIGYQA